MASNRGQEYSVTATTQNINTPNEDPQLMYTYINDDAANDVYYRTPSDAQVFAGTASELVDVTTTTATNMGGARLKAGELVSLPASRGLEVVCATGLTATLRKVPGMLQQSGDTDLATIADDIAALLAIDTDMTSVAVDVAAGAATELIAAPAAGHQLWIYGFELHANVQGTIQLLDDTPTAKTGTMPVGAGGGVARDGAYPIFKCATAKALDITAVTCDVDGIITYRDVTL